MADAEGALSHAVFRQRERQAVRSPLRLGPAHFQHLDLDLYRHLVRAVQRSKGVVRQTFEPVLLVSSQPRVQRLPADSPIPGHVFHGPAVRDDRQHRFVPLLRHAHLPHVAECQAATEVGVRQLPKLCKPAAEDVLSSGYRSLTRIGVGRSFRNANRSAVTVVGQTIAIPGPATAVRFR